MNRPPAFGSEARRRRKLSYLVASREEPVSLAFRIPRTYYIHSLFFQSGFFNVISFIIYQVGASALQGLFSQSLSVTSRDAQHAARVKCFRTAGESSEL